MEKPLLKPEVHGGSPNQRVFFRLHDPEPKPILFIRLDEAMRWVWVRPDREQRHQHIQEWLEHSGLDEVCIYYLRPACV
jgi:hypothetical protein